MTREKNSLVSRGCYTLVISLRRKKWIQVGRLGRACFPRGIYLYTGSAMNGLSGRLSHHLRKRNKKSHWHIDYLLKSPEANIEKIFIHPAPTSKECRLNQQTASLPGAKAVLKGFGASDCNSGCISHLVYFPRKYSPEPISDLRNSGNNKQGEPVLWKWPS
ncbi:MAG: DUF123 domain-containing protein, partial [Candidatus Binatia bacterium]